VIDLDADGTDELLLLRPEYEGFWIYLARREGDRILIIGGI